MIDFKNGVVFKLSKAKASNYANDVKPLLINGEEVISVYSGLRDFVAFTNKRIIAVNSQGFTGKKKDFTTLPYSKIQAFSVETAGVFDMDSELELYFSSVGKVRFEFSGDNDVVEIGKIISEKIFE